MEVGESKTNAPIRSEQAVDGRVELRLPITIVAIVVAGVAAFEEQVGVSRRGAASPSWPSQPLPWLASLLRSAEFARGWKIGTP